MPEADLVVLHRNPWFTVTHRPDPATPQAAGWFRVVRPDSVMVVPVLADGGIVLIAGARDTTGEHACYELPAGAIDAGESAEDAARRELREETGFVAGSIRKLGEFVESPAISAARCLVFEAALAGRTSQALEPGERWTPTTHDPDGIDQLIAGGRIVDGTTLAGLRLWSVRAPGRGEPCACD